MGTPGGSSGSQDMFYPGTERQNGLEVRHFRQQAAGRLPGKRNIYIGLIADPAGTDPHVEVGDFSPQGPFPCSRVFAVANEQERHAILPL